MIDWVNEACHEWGYQTRRWQKSTGYPPRSMLGKIVEEGSGASSGFMRQYMPNVYEGQGQEVAIAVQRLKATMRMEMAAAVLTAHYLFPGKAKAKARDMGLDMPTYWRALHSAHCFLAGQMEAPQNVA